VTERNVQVRQRAKGFQVLNDIKYLRAAEKAAVFIQTTLYDQKNNTLLRRFRKGSAGLKAQLTDYAFFINGLLDLHEASFDSRWLEFSIQLTEKQVELFADTRGGGFFLTMVLTMRLSSDVCIL